ncbi:P-loop containing nucleoside triphosphate hydrolases superfamily protein [Hibiscus syriacus]|uniref:P-loop containing nucleoside triphosphate hydrolases superfamily protein n=1 Tax=Hibiscus syriacus TaxID=106335 RepID=A0A6A3ADD1_HIBSY|nr:P-loop containing nucleoside triphosphate hydrolases superfamily protein [Hibiscus syriacus]
MCGCCRGPTVVGESCWNLLWRKGLLVYLKLGGDAGLFETWRGCWSLHALKWDLGLPDNFEKVLIPRYPDHFSFVKAPTGVSALRLARWREEFAVSALERNIPGSFYLSLKCKTTTVALKEGYRRGKLVNPHPLVRIRQKFYHVMRTGLLYRGKDANLIPREDFLLKDSENSVEDKEEDESEDEEFEGFGTGDEYDEETSDAED